MCRDGAAILQNETKKLRKVASIAKITVREEKTFTDVLKALMNYARVISLLHKVSFVDGRMKDIVKDTLHFNFLQMQSRTTCIIYL